MNEMADLLRDVLTRIKPTEDEHRKEKEIISKIENILKKFNVNHMLVGSIAKGTDLRGDKDIDIFLLFPDNISREELKTKGLEIGKSVFENLNASYEIDYAEHPYVKGSYKGYALEIVPCFDTKKIKSAVDRTPHHTRYVIEKLKENPKLRDEIRLLKQFMKGIGIYGAEAKIRGFSGYLIELLVLHYGSFLDVLSSVSKWHSKVIIDIEKKWKNASQIKVLFPDDELIVIDPVDENRNVAAPVSLDNICKFKAYARAFLKNPNLEFFFPKPKPIIKKEDAKQVIKTRGTKVIFIKIEHEKINENTLYSQLRKTLKSIRMKVEKNGFRVMKSGFWSNEKHLSVLIFEFEVWKLPFVEKKMGPLILGRDEKNEKKFLMIYRDMNPYIENGRWYVDKERKFKDVKDFLGREVLKKKEGFGKHLRSGKFKVVDNPEDIISEIHEASFLDYLSEFFGLRGDERLKVYP